MRIDIPHKAASLIDALECEGWTAYAVGGCVRDALLGRTPHDWDIATSARPADVRRIAEGRGWAVFDTGIAHGTVTVHIGHEPFEVTTYRSDGAYTDGRHPDQVEFIADIEGDLLRRDFTINALAYHPSRGLVDVCGGADDLERGILKAVGDPRVRFEEDGLRILRALRFAATYGLEVEPATAEAVHECRNLLDRIARERITAELLRLICGDGAVEVLLDFSDVMAVCIPALAGEVGLDQRTPYHCYDVYEHSVRACGLIEPNPLLRLAALLHDVGKPATFSVDSAGVGHFKRHASEGAQLAEQICRSLRLPSATCKAVFELVRYHDARYSPVVRDTAGAVVMLGEERCWQLLKLMRADILAHSELAIRASMPLVDAAGARLAELAATMPARTLAELAIGGDDLIAAGMEPGPAMGAALEEALRLVAHGELPNERDALIAWAMRLVD